MSHVDYIIETSPDAGLSVKHLQSSGRRCAVNPEGKVAMYDGPVGLSPSERSDLVRSRFTDSAKPTTRAGFVHALVVTCGLTLVVLHGWAGALVFGLSFVFGGAFGFADSRGLLTGREAKLAIVATALALSFLL